MVPLLLLLAWSGSGATGARIWRDPGDVSRLNFGGALDLAVQPPTAPFRFEREDRSGTSTKIFVRDSHGTSWNVKFGAEVKPEAFCWRLLRACGYFVEPNFYVAEGRIEGMGRLERSSSSLTADGHFRDARFQWRGNEYRFVRGAAWRWERNPFAGTPQLHGLKLLVMLLSNFDNKDARVGEAGGPNTGVFATRQGERWYAFTDWGSAMGRWGDLTGQTAWRCEDFASQSRELVRGVSGGKVRFGFEGHIPHFADGITAADVAWLMRMLGRISDDQLRAGLAASGATPREAECFTRALRERIAALGRVADQAPRAMLRRRGTARVSGSAASSPSAVGPINWRSR